MVAIAKIPTGKKINYHETKKNHLHKGFDTSSKRYHLGKSK
jgi:hypothetical protein